MGLALYDLLQPYRPITVATGICASAATVILLAGQQRLATSSTVFMLHDPKAKGLPPWMEEDEEERKEIHKMVKFHTKRLHALYSHHMGAGGKMARAKGVFGVEEARRWGLITGVYQKDKV